jgi:hypothetical protein
VGPGGCRRPRDGATAPAPVAADPSAAGTHWASRPVARVEPPAVRDAAWPLSDVDRSNVSDGDEVTSKWDIVGARIEKVGTAFLGLTPGSARCRDHKFDPVSRAEYHAPAGVFGSTESVVPSGVGTWDVPVTHESPETLWERADRAPEVCRTEARAAAGAPAKQMTEFDRRLGHLAFTRPGVALAHGVRDAATVSDARVAVRGNPRAPGAAVSSPERVSGLFWEGAGFSPKG